MFKISTLPSKNLRFLALLSLLSLNLIASGNSKKAGQEKLAQSIVNQWVVQYLDLTKNCVGFSAPVAARAVNYVNIGMYEAAVDFLPDNRSLSGQLTGYDRSTWTKGEDELFLPHVINEAAYNLIKFFYKNMPPKNALDVEETHDLITALYKKTASKDQLEKSKAYAQRLTSEIIEWSKKDGGYESFNRNFPGTHESGQCPGCWVKTNPGYQTALLPSWGQNKLLIGTNGNVCDNIPFLAYSEDPTSKFYAENVKVDELFKHAEKEQEVIAEYWDDAPGFSGSPIGHFMSIALEVSKQHADLKKTLEAYAMIGIAINDAMIECWRLKYHYNLIRPITYIQRHIDKDFSTAIITPPFPEFPSGHSFQSGAGTTVLSHFFTDTLAFTDVTNSDRKDIDGTPRYYDNFTAMSEEMSLSRFYGGIHYLNTLNVSLDYGRKIALNTIESIQFQKEL